jgi:hypothetical protein
MTIMFKHINEPVRPVLELVADCPPDIAAAIDRMLRKSPEDRYPEIEEVARVLSAPGVTSESAVRTQLVQFAMAGSNRDVLKRVSTPRSPIPSSLVRKPKTRLAQPVQPAQPEKRALSRPILFTGLGVVAVAAAALAVTRPWQKAPATPEVLSVSVDSNAIQAEVESALPPVTLSQPDTQPTVAAETLRGQPPAARPAARPATTPAAPPPQVTSVAITGLTTLTVGGNSTLQAEARDAQGRPMAGRVVRWQSSAPEVVTVSGPGQLVARGPGRATVTATIDGVSHSVIVTVNPEEPVASLPPPPVRETTPSAPAVPAGPTEDELKEQVVATIRAYANALERGNISRVRQLYPGMPASQEQQLRSALAAMENLQVRWTVGTVDLGDDHASVRVTGSWNFTSQGQPNTLPASNTYNLERRGAGWVITDIR